LAAKLKLIRVGATNKPSYRIVVMDSRKATKSSYIDQVGYCDFHLQNPLLKLDEEKTLKWLRLGAQPTESVKVLFKRAGLWKRFLETTRETKKEVENETIS